MRASRWRVRVPQGVREGDCFRCMLGEAEHVIRCPAGCSADSLLDVRVGEGEHGTDSLTVNPLAPAEIAERGVLRSRLRYFLAGRAFSMFVLFLLLTLAYALQVFATMTMNEGCAARNPVNGSPVLKLYFNMFRGIGSAPECSSEARGDFCLAWNDADFWGRVDAIAGSSMQAEARRNWPVSAAVTPISSAMCLLALAAIAVAILKIYNESTALEAIGGWLRAALALTVLCWALSFVGVNAVVYTSTMSSEDWTAFFRAGYSFKALLEDSVAQFTPVAVDTCRVSIELAEGAVILSVATSNAFISCFIPCCALYAARGCSSPESLPE